MTVSLPISALTPAAAEEPVGDLVARFLAEIGVTTAFGVISIHNMPILDAILRQQRIRFVPARGEAGAMNMADAYARVSQTGLASSSPAPARPRAMPPAVRSKR